ncbi:SGNH/GDSL hydrolase family protein [Streptomyces sp. SID12488]|uniref:SGNH/GDSL hydrolase family protein n=1 Tax=Streptomyces sp. SID12488 TaxID=2706040 RepID=UPI0013DD67D8|nr:SGNH/GDSL hydrolase family protein [Streptomyces sp. SID12488]NEA66141.1 SGNH/GDSL hydrolase family protein [Streptomyces sp. SID12488]
MRTYVRAGLAGAVACGVLVTVITVGRGDDDSAPPPGPYVALGDSYTSGPGIPAQATTPAGCDRSDRNYPSLVARQLALETADFRDMSCSGAKIADLSSAQSTDNGVNPAQLSALTARTGLVTIGVGGNDIGFAATVQECVKKGVVYRLTGSGRFTGNDAPCHGEYVSDGADKVARRIDAAGKRLTDALAEVKRRAPRAEVYVVGYPAILPSEGKSCDDDMTLAPGDVRFLDTKERQLNSTLRKRAEAAGAVYVDTYGPSIGRDACAARDTRWIEPLMPAADAAPVHPNERGERGMADAVLRALKAAG